MPHQTRGPGFALRYLIRFGREACSKGSSLSVTSLVDQFYAEVQRMGGKRWDTSSLIARLDSADKA